MTRTQRRLVAQRRREGRGEGRGEGRSGRPGAGREAPVLALDDSRALETSRAGGKGANLARLRQGGFPVPDGFVVGADAYRRFVADAGLGALAERLTAGLDPADVAAVEAVSERLRDAFGSHPLPRPLADAVVDAWRALGSVPVAVRSSATAEDLPEASFAGQQETVLDVRDAEALVAAVGRCWSSLWTARALAYRARQGVPHTDVAVAVVVQQMVHADVAGVLFTVDPVTGRRDRVMVEATSGLAEALVGGRVTPLRWLLDPVSHRVVSAETGGRPVLLDESRLRELTDLGLRAARLLGAPQDVEWALDGARLQVVQSRPVTTLFPAPEPPGPGLHVYMPLNLVAQGFAEPFTPAGAAFFVAVVRHESPYTSLRRRYRWNPAWMPVVLGRIYYDVTTVLAMPRLARRLATRLTLKDPAAGRLLAEWTEREAHRLPRRRGWAFPLALTVWAVRQTRGLASSAAFPDRARRRLVEQAEQGVARLQQEAAGLTTPQQRLDFALDRLPREVVGLVAAELPPVYVGLLAAPIAEALVRRWLGPEASIEPVRRWLPHDPTMAMGTAVARLAVTCARMDTEPSATCAGMADFLARYGHRAPDREIDIGLPRFADDPTYVVELVRGCLATADPGALLEHQRQGVAEAAAAVAQLVGDVRVRRGPVRARMLAVVLDRARELGGLRERPKFDLVRLQALSRRLLQEVGAGLAEQDRLDDRDDVFFLDEADLRAALSGGGPDLRARAADARRTYLRELARRAVPRLLTSEGEALYGPTSAAEPAPGRLRGVGVSPGVHEGTVRVLDSPVGARLRRGEVLVADSTDPGWTPLFLLAGALVMEVGGVVSHGAIVAREYGIPAVADVAGVTGRLRDGQRVRVDGTTGIVEVLQR